jgi:hypothetical protein
MGSGGSPPQALPPLTVANTQQQYNTGTAEQNQAGSMVNQYNPYGSLTYGVSGVGPNGIPLYSANLQLNPQQQGLLNSLVGSQGLAGQQAQALLSGANYGGQSPTQAIGTGTSGISGQMMQGYMGLMSPFFTQQTQQLDTQLRNQGLTPSPTADPANPATWGPYERQMYQNQTTQSQQVGGAAATFQPQAFQEASTLYNLPAQLGTALAQFGAPTSPGSALVQTPGFNAQPVNFEGDVGQYQQQQMQAYQIQQLQNSAAMSGAFGVAGNVLGGLAKSGQLGNAIGSGASWLASLGPAAAAVAV